MSLSCFSSQIHGCLNYWLWGNNGTVHRGKQQALWGDRILRQPISAAAGVALNNNKNQKMSVHIGRCWPAQTGIWWWMLLIRWQNLCVFSIWYFWLKIFVRHSDAIVLFHIPVIIIRLWRYYICTVYLKIHCLTLVPDAHKLLLSLHSIKRHTLNNTRCKISSDHRMRLRKFTASLAVLCHLCFISSCFYMAGRKRGLWHTHTWNIHL